MVMVSLILVFVYGGRVVSTRVIGGSLVGVGVWLSFLDDAGGGFFSVLLVVEAGLVV